jgi:S1-C subfamily serine protease
VVVDVVQKIRSDPGTEEEELTNRFESLPPGFWRRFHQEFGRPDTTRGQGSGIIVREDGFILTSHHVIENVDRVEVRLKDGRRFHATVHATDPQSDVAVLKVATNGLPPARFADSNNVRVGEFAIAIGSPFSLDYTVTVGHVSAKGRQNVFLGFEGAMMDQDFIQTDANINPGNSGGPLVNIEGEVIGINTLIRGMDTGIGFAIPSNLAREVAEALITNGKYVRPWLGIGIRALADAPEVRDQVHPVESGVIVSSILPHGPAARSELKPADIILNVDGRPVATPQELRNEIRRKPIGRPVSLKVLRKDQTLTVNVSPAEWVQASAFTPPETNRVEHAPGPE